MGTEHGVAWSVEGGLGRIELQRPDKANALSVQAAQALARAIHAVLDLHPKVVMLTAQGRVFCAGGDIQEFGQAGDSLASVVDQILDALHPAIERLVRQDAPVISVVSGSLGGAGIGLALCADFVLASTDMKLRTGYASIGLSPDVGASYFLSRRIGSQKAKQWFLLSEAMDAQVCWQSGAVDELHAPAELMARAESLAQKLLAGARGAHAAIKGLCDGASTLSLGEHLQREHALMRQQAQGSDGREGVAAYLARRTPNFSE